MRPTNEADADQEDGCAFWGATLAVIILVVTCTAKFFLTLFGVA